jgi:hypothetical protein
MLGEFVDQIILRGIAEGFAYNVTPFENSCQLLCSGENVGILRLHCILPRTACHYVIHQFHDQLFNSALISFILGIGY